jgi:hypothetical protein
MINPIYAGKGKYMAKERLRQVKEKKERSYLNMPAYGLLWSKRKSAVW